MSPPSLDSFLDTHQAMALLQRAPVAIALIDGSGVPRFFNQAYQERFGWEVDDADDADSWWALTYPDATYRARVRRSWESAVQAARAEGHPLPPQTWDFTCKSGEVRRVEFKMTPLGEASFVTLTDVTDSGTRELRDQVNVLQRERDQLELTLQGRELALETINHTIDLLQDLPAAIIVTTKAGRITHWYGRAEAIFGWTADEARGQPLSALLSKPISTRMQRDIQSSGLFHGVVDCERKDGSELTIEMRVRRSERHPDQFIGVCLDVSQRKTLEARLRQSQKMQALGRMASGIAHDFNNLLSVILASAEVIELAQATPAPLAENALNTILTTVERASRLVQGLLTFGRPRPLTRDRADVRNLIEGLEPLLLQLCGETIALNLELQGDLGRVEMDPSNLEQILVNLATNACDAMPSGGSLRISARPVSDYEGGGRRLSRGVLFQIADTGEGIPEEHQERIFEPFFTTRTERGTGLGLSIVYAHVNEGGGHISYESDLRGTLFTVFLPSADARSPEEIAVSVPEVNDAHLSGHERVLLVEDNDDVREATRRLLEQFGYEVIAAPSADHAMSLLTDAIQVLLTDVVMPGQTGFELAESVHRERPELPVIFMSGHLQHARIPDALADAPLLEKPVPARRLLEAIRRALGAS